jgi:hypothetical protein
MQENKPEQIQPFQHFIKILQANPKDRALRVDRQYLEAALVQFLQLGNAYKEMKDKEQKQETKTNEDNGSVSNQVCDGEQRDRRDTEGTAGEGASSSSESVESRR